MTRVVNSVALYLEWYDLKTQRRWLSSDDYDRCFLLARLSLAWLLDLQEQSGLVLRALPEKIRLFKFNLT